MDARLDRRRWSCLLLGVIPLVVYLNSLQNPFHYDDFHSIADNPHIRDWTRIPAFFTEPALFSAKSGNAMYRPVLLASFALNWAISGNQVWSYHLLGLVFHLGCVYLLFLIGRLLLRDGLAAGAAALLFGLHPVDSECLNYVSSRSEILAGFFLLLGVWGFLQQGGWKRTGLVAGAYLAGLLSKEAAVVLPVVLLAWDAVFPGWRRGGKSRLYAVLGLIGGLYLVLMTWGWGFLRKAAVGAPVRPYREQVWTQVKALVYYAKLLLWPTGLNVDHQFLISDSLFDPFAASAFLFLASLVGLAIYYRRKHPLLLFLLLFALISLAPSTLVPLNVLVNEHRLYLPSACFSLALAYAGLRLASRGPSWHRAVLGMALGLVVAYGCATWARNRVWASDYTLWSDAAAKAPLMARPHFYLGEALVGNGRLDEAVAAYEKALQRDPRFAPGYARLAQLLQEQGQLAQAERVLERGLQAAAEKAELWSSLAEVYRLLGEREPRREEYLRWIQKSLEAYQQALALGVDDQALHNNLGNCLQELGRPQEALAHHRRALELDPGNARTLVNLGSACWSLGDLEAARQAFLQAVLQDSLYAGAWYNLGLACEKGGDRTQALRSYQKAADLDRGYAELLQGRVQDLQETRP